MFPVWYLDCPDISVTNPDPTVFEVKGWIAVLEEVKNLRFRDKSVDQHLSISTYPRPDVQAIYGLSGLGFEASCSFDLVKDKRFLELVFSTKKGEFEIIVPVHAGAVDVKEQKIAKLEKIRSILVCPECRSTELVDAGNALQCSNCSESYQQKKKNYNFLTGKMKKLFDIVPTSNVSANNYDGVSLNLIHKHIDGLILDCGAGSREKYYPNVVNYEIVAYESTDVVGVGEKLPFADDVFDAVFSFAVLEHVKDPVLCAKELARVLKPGGTIYCNIPFLQPLHGYPHHYFNMTQKGMLTLFDDAIDTEHLDVLNFGQPVFTLSWFLNSYLAGLTGSTKKDFMNMTVGDLLKPGGAYLGSPFVSELSPKVQEELACCNTLIGKKKQS